MWPNLSDFKRMRQTLTWLFSLLLVTLAPLAMAAAVAPVPVLDPALPNVLILGDSISIGYTPLVREGLRGRANVLRPSANCGDTRAGLANLEKWLGATRWDLIHFNWGLHDLCYRHPDSKVQGNRDKMKGTLSVALADYELNLDALVLRLKKTGAKLIWASTTVVPAEEAGRIAGDEVKYNAAAARVMKKHGITINDLHAPTRAFPSDLFSGPGNVHFKPEGYARIAGFVVQVVAEDLKKQ